MYDRIRPVSLAKVADCDDMPIIDLGCNDRNPMTEQSLCLCREHGFFQALDKVSAESEEEIKRVAGEIKLPVGETLELYSDDPSKTMLSLSTCFNAKKEEVHNRRDDKRLDCGPLEQHAPELPSNPPSFKSEKLFGDEISTGNSIVNNVKEDGGGGIHQLNSMATDHDTGHVVKPFGKVVNHGVCEESVEKKKRVADEFIKPPVEKKLKPYSDDPSNTMRLSPSLNVKKEEVHNLRDYRRLHCGPLEQHAPELPSNPSSFKRVKLFGVEISPGNSIVNNVKEDGGGGIHQHNSMATDHDTTKVLSSGTPHNHLPENCVRPESDRPRLAEVADCDGIPIIDLGCNDRNLNIKKIRWCCGEHGFFQVNNHGVPKELVEEMRRVADEFIKLPVEEKMKFYSNDPSKKMRFKEVVSTYYKEVRELGFRLEELISESLGLRKDYFRKVLGDQGQRMPINYYSLCPEPEKTFGLPGHTDPNAFTILLLDLQVSGLQVLKNGKWLAVKPHPDAFLINIGDQLQVQFYQAWEPTPLNATPALLIPPAHTIVKIPSQSSQLPIDTHHEYSPKSEKNKVESNFYIQMGFNSGPGTVGDGGAAVPSSDTGRNINISGTQETGDIVTCSYNNVSVQLNFQFFAFGN